MKKWNNYDNEYVYRAKKVKHVHFIEGRYLPDLENEINKFIDNHPEYKILGIKLVPDSYTNDGMPIYIATLTYLCDASGEATAFSNDFDDNEYESEEE